MKKALFASALVLFAAFGVFAQEGAAKATGPEITFESEVVDYGVIEHNADGNREFKFKNTGTSTLVISGCKGSCGCTVPKCPEQPIAPGETGTIKVKYATDRVGRFSKTVTVNSNAVSEPIKRLTIQGEVLPDPTAPAEGTSEQK